MKQITFQEWMARFKMKRDFDLPFELEYEDGDGCTFYDNGAVKNDAGDFIVKCDMVEAA